MNWQNAIKKSPRHAAIRFVDIKRGFKRCTLKYVDASGITFITINNRTDGYKNARPALSHELEGYKDWEPAI